MWRKNNLKKISVPVAFFRNFGQLIDYLKKWWLELFWGKLIIVFTMGSCAQVLHITAKFEFKIPTRENFDHMIELTVSSWSQYFLSD